MKIYANLKMNMNYDEIKIYKENVEKEGLIVFPSYIYMNEFNGFELGSQDVSIYKNGSYTGDISAEQLNSMNVNYCIIGHSERRKYYNENNEVLRLKLKQLIDNNIKPILCVGENDGEDTLEVLKDQLSILKKEDVIVAYEPVWAIGSGKIPTNEEIEKVVDYIKNNYNVSVLYGGSVDENNISELKKINGLSGFLVGKASCDFNKTNSMLDIIRHM